MQHIHARLQAGDMVNASIVARELEVSTRTVQRDLDCLRDSFGLPIEYDERHRTFRYSEPPGRGLFGPRLVMPEIIRHSRDDGTRADFRLPLESEPHGHLEIICQRHGIQPEHVLTAAVVETLAEAVSNSRVMDAIVRAARVLATDGREVA